MDIEKQRLLVTQLLSDHDLFATCHSIVKANYFDPTIKKIVLFSQNYFEKYKTVPSSEIVKAETGIELATKSLSQDQVKYAADQVEEFCKNKAIENAILGAPSLLQNGNFGKIETSLKEALSVGLNRNLGTDYFKDPELRLNKLLDGSSFIKTGWDDLDFILEGGVGRQELLLFGANSGVGKSVIMLNLALNLLIQRLNGIYFSFELAESVVAKRLDSMLTSIPQGKIAENIHKIASEIEERRSSLGKFFIKRLPESTTTANKIRTYVKEFGYTHGYLPDFMVLDYLDLMTTSQNIPLDNLFVKDKYVAEEVRALGFEFDCLMITASQLGRAALDAPHIHQGHIQGGISKINTADNFIAIIQNDQHRANGEYWFELGKTRNANGVGKKILLRWDSQSLRVSNNKQPLTLKRGSGSGPINGSGTVLDRKNKLVDMVKFDEPN